MQSAAPNAFDANHSRMRGVLGVLLVWLVFAGLALSTLTSRWILVIVAALWLAAALIVVSGSERAWLVSHIAGNLGRLGASSCVRFFVSTIVLLIAAVLGRWRGVALETDAITLGLALWVLGVAFFFARAFARYRLVVWIIGMVGPGLMFLLLAVVAVKRHLSVHQLLGLTALVGCFAIASWLVGNVLFADASRDPPSRFRVRLHTRHFHPDAERDRRIGLAALRGMCWILASGLVLVSAGITTLTEYAAAPSQLGRFGGPVQPPSGETELPRFYSPVLRLAEGEKWRAADPSVVLQGTFLQRPAPPESCPTSAKAPCGTVQIANRSAEARTPLLIPKSGVFAGGYVFPHLVDTAAASQAFGASSIPGQTAKVIEYWIYYAGDDWTTPSAVGRITQGHDGDWEWVGVGMDRKDNPLFTAYSAHCGGSWRPWDKTLVVAETADGTSLVIPGTGDSTPLGSPGTSDQPAAQLSHPLIAVAGGSHANYPTSAVRAPDWIGCTNISGLTGIAIDGLSYIANIRETISEFGSTQIPVSEPLDDPNLSLPLFWGPVDTKTVDGYPLPPAAGPAAPVYHPEFSEPLQTIFNRRLSHGRNVETHWSCDHQLDTCSNTP